MYAYVKALSKSYLLTLDAGATGDCSLAAALWQALRSSQRSVWVDCRHVSTLPAGSLRTLRHYAARLWQQGGHLVLWHLPEAARQQLAADSAQPLAASLLDAAQYGLDFPDALAA